METEVEMTEVETEAATELATEAAEEGDSTGEAAAPLEGDDGTGGEAQDVPAEAPAVPEEGVGETAVNAG